MFLIYLGKWESKGSSTVILRFQKPDVAPVQVMSTGIGG